MVGVGRPHAVLVGLAVVPEAGALDGAEGRRDGGEVRVAAALPIAVLQIQVLRFRDLEIAAAEYDVAPLGQLGELVKHGGMVPKSPPRPGASPPAAGPGTLRPWWRVAVDAGGGSGPAPSWSSPSGCSSSCASCSSATPPPPSVRTRPSSRYRASSTVATSAADGGIDGPDPAGARGVPLRDDRFRARRRAGRHDPHLSGRPRPSP